MTDKLSYSELVQENSLLRKRLEALENWEEEKQSKPSLLASEEMLVESLLKSYFFYTLNPEGEITFVSPSIKNVLGYKEQEFLAKYPGHYTDKIDNIEAEKFTKRTLSGEQLPAYDVECFTDSGEICWLEVSEIPAVNGNGELVAVECIARDITKRKRATEGQQDSIIKLRNALAGTVQAISMIVEKRDPFTAGHQHRVSSLARSIAQEMKLAENEVEGIRMAGLVHDLGKLSIPVEILSKPRSLNEQEFELVKTHAQAGYDILKEIHFHWPIAQIVLQHHERMDGSGYPNGLKGNEILLEARVVAVANVVEAMTSSRPYRPALEIEYVLEEIKQNAGTEFDPDVVDACINLFANSRFSV